MVLAGQPLNEPIAHFGPFVMNTREELEIPYQEYQSGRVGRL
jgi:redox-sensitive bicupin YhaK (pirin superfamily)